MLIYLIEFIILFVVAYLCYYFIGYLSDKNSKKKNDNRQMAEVKLFIKLYNINLKKASYKKLCKQIYFLLSLDLTITVFFAVNVPIHFILKVLLGIILLATSTILSYRLLGLYYEKKGMCKNV